MDGDNNELRLELRRDFGDFLEQDFGRETGEGKYVRRVDGLIKAFPTTHSVRLDVDLQDLADYSEELHRRALAAPGECLPAFQDALDAAIREKDPKVRRPPARRPPPASAVDAGARISLPGAGPSSTPALGSLRRAQPRARARALLNHPRRLCRTRAHAPNQPPLTALRRPPAAPPPLCSSSPRRRPAT
jgi:DNA replicative helicase MCM subunit Mcm2 (Cdc46/Mcm family)